MSFLYPVFLFGAALAAIPIVLHFLRRDVAPEVPFTAVRLLRKSPIERSRRRRLRDLLLLAARVAALLLFAAAFARPYLDRSAAATSRVRIVAIDRSFSMGAPGTFARALDLARRAIDEAGGDRVAVIAFDERADVIASPGTAADARASVAALQPGFGGTRYAPVIAKANEVSNGAPGTLVVVTDLQRAGWEDETGQPIASRLQLRIADAGGPSANTAVVHLSTAADRITAAIRNSGTEVRTGRLHATIGGRELAAAPFTVPPGAVVDVNLTRAVPPSGTLAVSIDDPGGFPADDVRFAVLDAAILPRVLVVTSPGSAGSSGLYVARALDVASSGSDGFDVRTVTAPQLPALSEDDRTQSVAIVLLSTRALTRPARDALAGFVRQGGGLLIAASPEVDGSVLASVFDWRSTFAVSAGQDAPVALAAADLRHPIFRPFGALTANLAQVHFSRGWHVRPEGWDVAARFTDGSPALLDRIEGNGRVVLFASDLDRRWNDFPLHPSFVPFAVEAVRYVARPHSAVREYMAGAVPAGAPSKPGVFRTQPQNRLIAVNVDPRESSTARVSAEEFDRMVERVPAAQGESVGTRARQTEATQNLWRYGLMLMLMTLVAESAVGKA